VSFLDRLFGDPRKTEAHAAALKFRNEIAVDVGKDYAWVAEYAKTLWAYREASYKTLDEKADSIIKYLGGGTGLFAIGVLSKIDVKNAHIAAFALFPLLAGIVAVFLAIYARIPMFAPDPTDIKTAKEIYADGRGSKEEAIAAFLGQWHYLCECLAMVNDKKAFVVMCATWLYWFAIALLAVPLVVAIFWPPV
jgi:hypothetical protein